MMYPRIVSTGRLLFVCVLACALLPVSARAQAGLTGSALNGQAEEMKGKTPFNKGFQSKSALGQLEELTGSKVDRSAPAQAPIPRPAPKISRSTQMRNELKLELTGMFADALVQMIFSDNSAQKKAAAEAAAQAEALAAAQAEAFRVQQELARLARIRQAQRYRAEWDSRETEIGDRLGDVFTVRTGPGYFGEPAGPEAAGAALLSQVGGESSAGSEATLGLPDSDPMVVDLRGSSGVVPLIASPVSAGTGGRSPSIASRTAYEMTDNTNAPPPPAATKQLNALIAYFGPWLGRWYWETVVQGYAKSTAWGRLKGIPGMGYVNAVVGADDQRKSGIEELGGVYTDQSNRIFSDTTHAAAMLANPYSNGDAYIESTSGSLDHQVRELKVKLWEMTFKGFSDRSEMPGADDLQAVRADGNLLPIHGRGSHPDNPRTHRILFGRPAGR